MFNSTIYVNRNGSPAQGIKVEIAFDGGGMPKSVRTDRQGKANISHTKQGTGTLFVNGRRCQKERFPTTTSVSI